MPEVEKLQCLDRYLSESGLGARAASISFKQKTAIDPTAAGNLYEGNWIARRIVEEFPRQFVRADWSIDGDTDGALRAAFDAIDGSPIEPSGSLFLGLVRGRMLGGAAIVVGVLDGGDPATPLTPGRPYEIGWLTVVDGPDLTPKGLIQDQNLASFGTPATYQIGGTHPRKGLIVDASRVILCEGHPRAKPDLTGTLDKRWVSVLNSPQDVLTDAGISWEAVAHLLQEASIGVFGLDGLLDMLAAEDPSAIKARLELLAQGRSIAKSILLDSQRGETFTRSEVGFGGIADLLRDLMLRISGAAEMPLTVLFGQAPAGMNATGTSDLTQFYDRISAYRRTSIASKIARILEIQTGAPQRIKFGSLWEPTKLEASQARAQNATADRTYWEMGAVEALDIAQARSDDGSLGVTIDVAARRAAQAEAAAGGSSETSIKPDLTPSAQEALLTVRTFYQLAGIPESMIPEGAADLTVGEFKARQELAAKVAEAAALPDTGAGAAPATPAA